MYGLLTRDTIWSDTRRIQGLLEVERGTTLIIEPWTTIEYGSGAEIMVKGGFQADQVKFVPKCGPDENIWLDLHTAHPTQKDAYADASLSMTDCIIQGSLDLSARNAPVFDGNSILVSAYLLCRDHKKVLYEAEEEIAG